MRVGFYIVSTKNGSVRTTKTKPAIKANEVAIKINLEIPDVFYTKPEVAVNVSLPTPSSAVVIADIEKGVRESLIKGLGSNLKVTVDHADL